MQLFWLFLFSPFYWDKGRLYCICKLVEACNQTETPPNLHSQTEQLRVPTCQSGGVMLRFALGAKRPLEQVFQRVARNDYPSEIILYFQGESTRLSLGLAGGRVSGNKRMWQLAVSCWTRPRFRLLYVAGRRPAQTRSSFVLSY